MAAVEDELAAIDRACSRFRDDSELSALNRSAGEPFAASPLLIEAVEVALRAARITDGDVDPTIGRAMAALGWDCDFSVLVSRDERERFQVVPAAGWRSIVVADGVIEMPAGAEIDLGRDGQGARRRPLPHAPPRSPPVTRSARQPRRRPRRRRLRARRRLGRARHRRPPHARSTRDGQTVAVRSGGLATSSTTVRRWRAGGREHHHIVDPRTGLPAAEVWRTVSVAAATCVDANTASTAAVVRGREAPAWLDRMGLPARLVALDGSVSTTGAWPEETP